jgi:hypothetical protein
MIFLFLFSSVSIKDSLIPECVTPASADAVLIFWDSDVSDVNENAMSDSDRISLRLSYEASLASALGTLIKTGIAALHHHI